MSAISVSEGAVVSSKTSVLFSSLDTRVPIHVIPTSFVAETEVVAGYLKLLAAGRPTAAYEFVQNQWDYNNDARGTPEIWLVTPQGKYITYPEFTQMSNGPAQTVMDNCARVEFRNHLIDGKGLGPQDVVHTKHGGGEGTLGAHGQGGKAAGAALVAGRHAQSIEYISRDAKGPWRGQAVMALDHERFPDQTNPSYTLGYQRLPANEEQDQTVITIHKPSTAFLKSLRILPNYFLPTNSKYEHYRFNHSKELSPQANMFTVTLDRQSPTRNSEQHMASFDPNEQTHFHIPKTSHREAPRVEILPWDITTLDERYDYKTDHAFVDGLLVDTGYNNYALRWSFWGFDKGDSGYQAKRSTDSAYMQGEPRNLIGMVLGKCTNPKVFEAIFEASSGERDCIEGTISEHTFIKAAKTNPSVQSALSTAWQNYCKLHSLTPDKTMITSSQSVYDKAVKQKIQPTRMNAPALVSAMHEFGISKKVEDTVDLPADPQSTGETTKLFFSGDITNRSEDYDIQKMLSKLFELNATLRFDGNNLIIDLPARKATLRPDLEVKFETSEMRYVLNHIWSRFGPVSERRTQYDPGEGQGYELIERPEQNYWDKEYIYVKPEERPFTSSGSVHTRIQVISMGNHGMYESYIRKLKTEFKKVSTDGQHVDQAKLAEFGASRIVALQGTLEAKEQELADVESAIAGRKQQLETERLAELQHIEAQISDAQRMLGKISEDASADSPTRNGLMPKPQTDYKTPLGFRRQFTTLYSPEARPQARNVLSGTLHDMNVPAPQLEDVQGIKTADDARLYVESQLEALEKPDIQLLRPQMLPATIRDTLICHINPRFAKAATYESIVLENKRTIGQPGIAISKRLEAGTYAIPCFPNSRVTGFYHPDIATANQVNFTHSLDHNTYTLHSDITIPPGIEFYYEYDPKLNPNWNPGSLETTHLGDLQLLNKPWQQLIKQVNNRIPPFTPKEKLDIALTAWLHAFNYDKDPRIDNLFRDLPPQERFAEIINRGVGNCGYVAEGFVALCRFFELPSVEMIGYLGNKGRYFPGPQNHGLSAVYLNNEWVVVEPQLMYLSAGYSRQELSSDISALIEQIPAGKNIFPQVERSTAPIGVEAIVQHLRESGIRLDDETIAMLRRIQTLSQLDDETFQPFELDEPPIPGTANRVIPRDMSFAEIEHIISTNPTKSKARLDSSGENLMERLSQQAAEWGISIDSTTSFEDLLYILQQRMKDERAEHEHVLSRKLLKEIVVLSGATGVALSVVSLIVGQQTGILPHMMEQILNTLTQLSSQAAPSIPAIAQAIPPKGSESVVIPQFIDELRINSQVIKIIITALLSTGATSIFDAVRYNRVIRRLKALQPQPEYENF